MQARRVFFKDFGNSNQSYLMDEQQTSPAGFDTPANGHNSGDGVTPNSDSGHQTAPPVRQSRFGAPVSNDDSTNSSNGANQRQFFQTPGAGEDVPSFFNNQKRAAPRMQQPPMGMAPRGFPPFGQMGMPGMRPPFTQQPMNHAERLKKIAGVPPGKELWIETKTGEGKSYYYHAISRETVWERPADQVILEQAELQKLIEKAQREEKEAASKQEKPVFPGFGFGAFPHFGMSGFPAVDPAKAWQEHTAPDGRKYYYNPITQENTWNKPDALKSPNADSATSINLAASLSTNQQSIQSASAAYAGFQQTTHASSAATEKKSDGKGRPVNSTPVPGSPWCVVWTSDGKVFFYNPSTKTSVWDRPPELYGRPDVDVLVTKPPDGENGLVGGTKRSHSEAISDEERADSTIRTGQDDDNESNASGNGSTPVPKKTRKEKKEERRLEEQRREMERKIESKKQQPKVEKPIDPAIKAELDAQIERAKIPLEDRIKQFREMLEEKKISASSTWERELSKIVFDSRYLLLTAAERRAAFEAHQRELREREKIERRKAREQEEAKKKRLREEKSAEEKLERKDENDKKESPVDRSKRKSEERDRSRSQSRSKKHKKEKRSKKEKKREKGSDHKEHKRHRKDEKAKDEKTKKSDDEETSSNAQPEMSAAEKALEARKQAVREELNDSLKERDKELKNQKLQEQEESFQALLIDLIKSPELSWHDAKKLLKDDPRYDSCDLLRKRQKERLFDDHMIHLERKIRKLNQEQQAQKKSEESIET